MKAQSRHYPLCYSYVKDQRREMGIFYYPEEEMSVSNLAPDLKKSIKMQLRFY